MLLEIIRIICGYVLPLELPSFFVKNKISFNLDFKYNSFEYNKYYNYFYHFPNVVLLGAVVTSNNKSRIIPTKLVCVNIQDDVYDITITHYAQFLQKCANLRRLEYAHQLRSAIDVVFTHKQVRKIKLYNQFKRIECENLRSLYLECGPGLSLSILVDCPRLKKLVMRRFIILRHVEGVTTCSKLECVKYYGNSNYCDGLSDVLKICDKRLKTLVIESVLNPMPILGFTNLKRLELNRLGWLTDEMIECMNNRLEHVKITYCVNITKVYWGPNLKTIDLTECSNVTDVSCLTQSPKLKRVVLIGCTCIKNLGILKKCTNLVSLVVSTRVDLIKMNIFSF